jgi:hypothetical protein
MNKFLINKINFIAIHFISFTLIFCILYLFKFINILPSLSNLLNWDAAYYFDIANNGYQNPNSNNHNTAFFPLFPFFIYLFKLNGIFASLFNLVIFYTSLYLLFETYKIEIEKKLLIISFPSLVFCFIPYTESLFLLFSTIFLIGIHNRNIKYVFLGVILASITRTSALVFIPAFTFLIIIDLILKRSENLKIYLSGISASILGTLIVYLIQYLQTGVWFANFKVMKHWDRVFSIPSFKLTTWGEFNLLWLDSHAYLYFIISVLILVYISINILFNKKDSIINNYSSELYSLTYIVLIGLTVLLYSPKAYDTYTTIFGINRYVFSTAFFIISLIYFLNEKYLYKNLIKYFLVTGLVIIFIQFYSFDTYYLLGQKIDRFSLKYFIYFMICCLYFSLPFIYKYIKKHYAVVFIINIFLQVYLYNLFINKEWIG